MLLLLSGKFAYERHERDDDFFAVPDFFLTGWLLSCIIKT